MRQRTHRTAKVASSVWTHREHWFIASGLPGELDETLREIAQFSQKISLLPDEAFSRENLYRDHD
jgi:hypothetical protein